MVFPDLRGDAEVGAKEGGAEFCDQLLAGIAHVAEPLVAEITIETCFIPCPVPEFVKDGDVVAFLVLKSFKGRKLDVVGCRGVISLTAAEADGGTGGGAKLVSLGETFGKRERICRLRVEVGGEAFDLFNVEYRIALHEGEFHV